MPIIGPTGPCHQRHSAASAPDIAVQKRAAVVAVPSFVCACACVGRCCRGRLPVVQTLSCVCVRTVYAWHSVCERERCGQALIDTPHGRESGTCVATFCAIHDECVAGEPPHQDARGASLRRFRMSIHVTVAVSAVQKLTRRVVGFVCVQASISCLRQSTIRCG